MLHSSLQGFALAERLYRTGVEAGMLKPIEGIPTTGMYVQRGVGNGSGACCASICSSAESGQKEGVWSKQKRHGQCSKSATSIMPACHAPELSFVISPAP